VSDACLADVKTLEDWQRQRPELRRQFLEMMGLWPLPPRTDLKPVITGKLEADAFTVERLHFQSLPGLYVTGNLYVPKQAKVPAPAVLYVCGHANTVVQGVSFGSKVNYQHHPAWFARNGYVCLILDTLQLGEIEGIHHGTSRLGLWGWHSLGYTPAGIECWNAVRALDYLEARPEVDPKRLAVTGRSGGGATSWWVAAADDRPQCIVPVAGIADLQAHVVEGVAPRYRNGVISGHCDCMYLVNTYRWDFPTVAALCAPRPLLLGNSDADDIFPVPGYRRLADKVRRVYELYGAADKFALLETPGPHKDTPVLRDGAFRWMNRWLKGDTGDVSDPDLPRFEPQQLRVFTALPTDAMNKTIQDQLLRPARPRLPDPPAVTPEWWQARSREWRQALREKVFRGWDDRPPPLAPQAAADVTADGLRLRAFDFTSEAGVDLRLWLLTAEGVDKPTQVVLNALDEPGWRAWTEDLGPAFREALHLEVAPERNEARSSRNRKTLQENRWAFAAVAPRGIGPTRWATDGSTEDTHARRRFVLLGQTLDGQRVWDVRRAFQVLRGQPGLQDVPIATQGKGPMAGVALYAALFEPDVARVDLWHPPASHLQGPFLLNVCRVLDMPQAVALALPRPVRIHVRDAAEAAAWEWPLQLERHLGQDHLQIRQVGESD
jgi:dienelactone hydrolase